MAYTYTFGIVLGESDTGLTLRGQIVDSAGANVGAAFTAGFAEISNGAYRLTTDIPDEHRGGIIVMDDSDGSQLAYGAINPEQGEGAVVGAEMDLVNAPNATAVTAIQSGLSTHDANAVRDAILTDATRFAGAHIDAAISSLPGAEDVARQTTFRLGGEFALAEAPTGSAPSTVV